MKRERAPGLVFAVVVAIAVALALLSCAPTDFPSQTIVDNVRIMASRADKPYAKPGDIVNVDLLAFDGRTTQLEPMQLSWLPLLCKNPLNDAYYACFSSFAGGGGGGGDDGGGGGPAAAGGAVVAALMQPGVDLTPFLKIGPSFQFKMPADAVTSHPAQPGVDPPYGLIILFNFACAGHMEFVPVDPANQNPQAIPFGCFDKAHHALGPNDFVFGFTRVYAYDTLTNANPVIEQVDLPGGPVTAQAGVTSAFQPARCTEANIDNCPEIPVGPIVNPPEANESVAVSFYTTLGKFKDDVRLLYDTNTGSLGGPADTDTKFLAPNALPAGPGPSGFLWMIVRDNRGGTDWITVPVHVL